MKESRRILKGYLLVVLVYLLLIPLIIILLGTRLNRLLGLGSILPHPYSVIGGLIAFAYGWFWIIWSQINIIKRGEGHPNEILGRELGPLTKRLVTNGPYNHSRNPMAYGLIIFYFLALPLLCNSTLPLALFPLACLFEIWYHKKYEEPGLLERFGEDYEKYKKRVPLLFPFMRRLK